MSKKSRRSQKRRRQRRRQNSRPGPLDVLNLALGEFLTACGELEFKMILFADRINEAGIERIFSDLSGPFGPKIKAFKDWCGLGGVSDAKKPVLQRVYNQLDDLLPIRNFLVHGETLTGRIKGGPTQPYRVGIIKKELDYMDGFERGEHSENVFSAEQVRAATARCRKIIKDLDTLLEPASNPDGSGRQTLSERK